MNYNQRIIFEVHDVLEFSLAFVKLEFEKVFIAQNF